ncbi:hypothetical protein M8745_20715, partial [Lutimaribacter sp. EGI FJ00014]|nr:hypothetical protein [Lutimaribacter sp. EGI FJ00014]
MNPDYQIVRLTCVAKNNVSLITGEDGNGNLTAEAMTPFMSIALFVALFLLNSDRIQKAIEICNECLILLNNTDQNSKDPFISLIYTAIYTALFGAYRSISDYISAERYGMKLLVLLSETG